MFTRNKEKYAFILGRAPAFSRVEIVKILEAKKIKFTELFYSKKLFIIELEKKLEVIKLQEQLGGTIKISKIEDLVLSQNINKEIEEAILHRPRALKINKNKKFQFGFSLFGEINQNDFKKLGLDIKKKLKDKRIKSRFVVSKEKNLSSVIVKKEKLIDQGIDLLIIKVPEGFYLGYTVSVQDFKGFSKRDYGRPTRDDKSGMLPPKLARMMINLSQADLDKIILDPFCGSGTVIQEALLLGYKNIIGSDISQKAVEFTQNNINWLQTKYNLDISDIKIFQLDVIDLLDMLEPNSVDIIITEPFLGPPNKLQLNQAKGVIAELSDLYLKSFRAFYQVLKEEGKVVMVFPVINNQYLSIVDKIKALGFEVDPLSKEPRGSITYSRAGQTVLREIFVFNKK